MPRIAVAGAGIGGLAAALALADVGCAVDVYERTQALAEVGAGVQLSPNASLVLERLGILDGLRADAVTPTEVLIRRARDARVLAHDPARNESRRPLRRAFPAGASRRSPGGAHGPCRAPSRHHGPFRPGDRGLRA